MIMQKKRKPKAKVSLHQGNSASDQRGWPIERLHNFLEAIREYEMKSGATIGWTHIRPQKVHSQEKN